MHHIRVALATVTAALTALVALACTASLHRPATGGTLRLTYHIAPLATPDCVEARTPERVSGTRPGGTADGADAILTFHHAFYGLRSGTAAREVVATDARVPSSADIQVGIDSLPLGTRFCVHVTSALAATDRVQRWNVEVAQQVPGAPEITHRQFVTTRVETGHTLITAIAAV
ncbi:hypothetical protein HGA13_12290 [Nocardia speluncae]|uniref:DUF8176 domain-containing protein n=1 Tax=Nocardia speluncae TaxID=419477 RepID=A0A846XD41_9NOCA|nr:hypothetical protein [Nocardia speluncae]NKY33852.1 hypothetical protein [Nocardia speluncae]